MCWEDVKIGAKATAGHKRVTVATTVTQLVPPNDRRVSLLIGCPPTNRITLVLDRGNGLDQGVTLYPGGPPLLLDVRNAAGLVNREILAISAVANQDISFFEAVVVEKP